MSSSRTSICRRTATASRSSTSKCFADLPSLCPACHGLRPSMCAAWRWCPAPASIRLQRNRCISSGERATPKVLNVHNDQGIADVKASLGQLTAELPNVDSISLVVSWFGDDLRCDRCALRPAVEQGAQDGTPMRWEVSGCRARCREARRPDRWSPIVRRDARRRVGAAGHSVHERDRPVRHVLSVHSDGYPGRQRVDRPLDRRGRAASGAVARSDHAVAGAGPSRLAG